MLVTAATLVVAGLLGGAELGRRAAAARRFVDLFASERIVTAGDVVRLRTQGGRNDRVTAHYRYLARGRELAGAARLRRAERDRYVVGSPVAIWYLGSEPGASWLDGYPPQPAAGWPGAAVPLACGVAALALVLAVRRQWTLLAHGRPAMATVTKVEQKKTEKGTHWMVHYEWSTLSGATRNGKCQRGRNQTPAVGELIPIVYDRDNSVRHSSYPMSFVRIGR
jgi:hypothetical protein